MLERATGFQPNVGEGRFMVHARHQQHPWTSASNPIVMPKGEAGPTMPWFELAPARATSLRLLAPPGKLRLGKPASLAGPPGNFRLGKRQVKAAFRRQLA
jgi:hypothetical protein